MKAALALCLAATALPAQEPGQAHARLADRVPGAALGPVESLIARSADDGLPVEPLIRKALEGAAKGAAPERIVAAVRLERAALRDAQLLLLHAGAVPPITASEIATVAQAVRRGVPASLIAALAAANPGQPRGLALHALADLMAEGVDADDAYGLVADAARAGVRGERLLDMARVVREEVERGRSVAEAVTRVRTSLPPEAPGPVPSRPVPQRRAAPRP